MRFYEQFGIIKGDIAAVAGAGGKTGLIMHLASELQEDGYKVLISTTTRMAADEISDEFSFLVEINGIKAEAPDINDLRRVSKDYDITLMEADGSACKPLKGWRNDEPVIPDFATLTLGVVNISTVGTLPEIHRPELFSRLTGDPGTVSVETLAALINNTEGIFRNSARTRNIVYLSKAETERDETNAIRLSNLTGYPVFYGSIRENHICGTKPLSAVIMAAGSSRRMGENKLLLPLKDKAMIRYLLDSLPYGLFSKTALICSDERVGKKAETYPLAVLKADKGHEKNLTIRIGTEACTDSAGMMFLVADQPFLSPETIERLTRIFMKNPDKIIIPICGGKQRNPVIFPQMVYSELISLKGDHGGRDVINRHPELCLYAEFEDEKEFTDIDTRQEYERHL